jgi:hypothetical protein
MALKPPRLRRAVTLAQLSQTTPVFNGRELRIDAAIEQLPRVPAMPAS